MTREEMFKQLNAKMDLILMSMAIKEPPIVIASGSEIDCIGKMFGLVRKEGEPDDLFRERILRVIKRQNPGGFNERI